MADSTLPPEGDYELTSYWTEQTKWAPDGKPIDWVEHKPGDVVHLSATDAARLLKGPIPGARPTSKRQANNPNVQAIQAAAPFPEAIASAVQPITPSPDGTPVPAGGDSGTNPSGVNAG